VRKPKRKGEDIISKDEESFPKIATRITRSTDERTKRKINREGGTKKYKKISIKRNNKIKKQRTKKNRKHRNKRKKK
jgi:hypothetical protein